MTARISTVAFQGFRAVEVDVQVQLSAQLPAFTIVGLPDKAVAESRERVRAAMDAIGLGLPPKRIIVNLSPADLPKEGSHYDLPIALGLLAAMDVVDAEELQNYVVLGELALDGAIAPVTGALPAALAAAEREKSLICPAASGPEAAWAGDIGVLAPDNLLSLINHFKGTQVLNPPDPGPMTHQEGGPDLRDIKGQEGAKRALEIAAAGGHNLLLIGPPGAGKSMLSARLPGILPPMTPEETLDVMILQSLAGDLPDGTFSRSRPFRSPHHSASMPALVGGGLRVRPGEISLAHRGVLFLDELPEFPRQVLESLRQPLETGEVSVARANAHVTYPARFQLVAAMNPCRCGHLGDAELACSRAPRCGGDYQAKISGPLLDRFDMVVEVQAVPPADLGLTEAREGSSEVRQRVFDARDTQAERYEAAGSGGRINAEADGELLEQTLALSDDARQMLIDAANRLKLSARGYYRTLRVARTIADLAGSAGTERTHVAEALTYRRVAARA